MSKAQRIAPLESLPLFHQLAGKRVIVAGSSSACEWKEELLAAAGAKVIRLSRGWTRLQLSGTSLAVGDFADREEALDFASAARKAGALVNIVDRPDLSDVQFGSIVNRSPVVLGISTNGACPTLGQSIRARIEAILPGGISDWAEAARSWRPRLKQQVGEFEERRAFWQRFVAATWADPDRVPVEADLETLLEEKVRPRGRVTLVGAGPGDPDLLTLKAVRALQSATVVLHDHLIGPGVLELARREARRIDVGKIGYGRSCKQNEINTMMVELALAGEHVVRLKGGDPLIFGRACEEIDACQAGKVDISIVPGISAAQGAAATLMTSLTERHHARRIQFITGHGADGKLPADIDWMSIVDRKATTVIYMPRGTLDEFVRKSLAKGLDPATPAVAIASVSLPEEAHVAGTIAEIGALADLLPAGAPVTVLVGWVARRHSEMGSNVLPFQMTVAL